MRCYGLALIAAAVCGAPACTDADRATPRAGEETVFDPMADTIDEARQVDDLARSRMDTLNETLERSEGAEDP